ncbi:MAG: response regulator [Gallionella sp.]|nr:response regulator [Gallionella sp.]
MQQTCHTILLLASDPNHIDAARIAANCSDMACELEVLSNVDAALDWLDRARHGQLPCLVLMDLQLPKLDSWAVLRKMRLNHVTADLPVLVYSSEYTQADVLLSYQAGANSFIAKPQDEAQFLDLYGSQLSYWLTSARQQSVYATL